MTTSHNSKTHYQVVEFPDKVKILGNFTRVYIEGKEKHFSELTSNKPKKTGSSKQDKHYMIIPIQQKDSKIEFVQIPFYKLSSKLKANHIGNTQCEVLNFEGKKLTMNDLPRWEIKKEDFEYASKGVSKPETRFVFQQYPVKTNCECSDCRGIRKSLERSSIKPPEENVIETTASKDRIKEPWAGALIPEPALSKSLLSRTKTDSKDLLKEPLKEASKPTQSKSTLSRFKIDSKDQVKEPLKEASISKPTQSKDTLSRFKTDSKDQYKEPVKEASTPKSLQSKRTISRTKTDSKDQYKEPLKEASLSKPRQSKGMSIVSLKNHVKESSEDTSYSQTTQDKGKTEDESSSSAKKSKKKKTRAASRVWPYLATSKDKKKKK